MFLSACEIYASGEGTVTVTSSGAASTFTVAHLCEPNAAQCLSTDDYLYSYRPIEGTTIWVVAPGFPVVDRDDRPVGLPAGRYTLQVDGLGSDDSNVVEIDVYSTSERDLTIWHQAYAREDPVKPCESTWHPSWAQWPNDGAGGFVCVKEIYAFYPDLPIPPR
jgi:hypothetical protein